MRRREMYTTRSTVRPVAAVALALALALTAAACGGDSTAESTAASTTAAPEATTGAAPTEVSTTTEAAIDPNEWIANLNDARRELNKGIFESFERLGNAATPGWGTLAFEVEHVQRTAEISAVFLPALADAPSELASEAGDWAALIQTAIDADVRTAEAFEGLGLPMDSLVQDLPQAFFDELYGPEEGPSFAAVEACFALAEAAADAGLDIVDCTNSEEEVSGDVAGPEGPGPVQVGGHHDLTEPGVYTFETLPLPFSIEIDEPTSVIVGEEGVEFFVEGAGYAPFFHVVAVDEIVDPAVLLDNNGPYTFDQMVLADDLAGWFDQLPFEIETGVSTVGDIEAPYWRLLDIEFTGGELPMYAWARSSLQGGHLITPGSVFWEVPHADGSLIVYATKVVEAPDDVPSAERLAIGEAFLAMLRVP